MKYMPILKAIKAILVADGTANGLIEVYRFFDVEQGVSKTPVCVVGSTTELVHAQTYLGASGGSRPRLWTVLIGILILGRGYQTQTQLLAEAEILDSTQAAVYTALNVDTTITSTVTISKIERVHNVTVGEYFGHEIIIEVKKKE